MSCFSCRGEGTGSWCQYCKPLVTKDCFGCDIEPGRVGTWYQTFTGRKLWPRSPRPEDIAIEDIAIGVARECRYGKQTLRYYSVAEHSVIVSRLVERISPHYACEALLHDCDEGYLSDMPRPLKHDPEMSLERLRACGKLIQTAAFQRFGVRPTEESNALIDAIDKRLVLDEVHQLMRNPDMYTVPHAKPTGVKIDALGPEAAMELFLARFAELFPAYADEIDRSLLTFT